MTPHPGRIQFYYPGDPDEVFSIPEVPLNELGGSLITDGVELALAAALLDFNEVLRDKLVDEQYEAAVHEDNVAYDQIGNDCRTVVENIGEIAYVRAQIIRLRSN